LRTPQPRGPLSEMLLARLGGAPRRLWSGSIPHDDPLSGDDLHLALYVCYELHYRGFDGVDDAWEWEPGLLALRNRLELIFEDALLAAVPRAEPDGPIEDALRGAIAEDTAPSPSRFLEASGTLEQFREFVVHRSAYQLKEADPHSWAIPRLDGGAKAALVEIQSEEYGSGKAEQMHAELFRTTMRGLGLDDSYGAYIDHVPGPTLATVNLMSLFGLHRRWRGAIVGHLALFEMTSTEPNARYAAALRRLGADPSVIRFYDEHVEADADHEIVAARDMAGGLIAQEPGLAADVLFGAGALLQLEGRFASRLIDAWRVGDTSLRMPISEERPHGGAQLRPAAAI
jgi:Iron-containing redox enzyme